MILRVAVTRYGDKPGPQYWSWTVYATDDKSEGYTAVASGMHCKSKKQAQAFGKIARELYEVVAL